MASKSPPKRNLSNLKSARQAAKRYEPNRSAKSRMRTFCKKVLEAVAGGNLDEAQASLRDASSVMSVTAQKGIIHKNQAARRIRRLNAKVKALAMAAPAA